MLHYMTVTKCIKPIPYQWILRLLSIIDYPHNFAINILLTTSLHTKLPQQCGKAETALSLRPDNS